MAARDESCARSARKGERHRGSESTEISLGFLRASVRDVSVTSGRR